MSIYTDFFNFIMRYGEKVGVYPGLVGDKLLIKYKDYLIQIDNEPFDERDLIVSIINTKSGELVYISPRAANSAAAFGVSHLFPISKSNPKILENLLENWKKEVREG